MEKTIFVTGGVCSSLGKGVAAASLGCLLESSGLRVTLQKIDPYLNVDPGTMNPYQHGEVYVTDDGAETDLDLGYYERFTSAPLSRDNSVTTGRVYQAVIERERHGEYLGQTVQVIPHITNEIKSRILTVARNTDADVQLCEIGGTVGDIESVPFLEAIRQYGQERGRENVIYIHLTLIPYIGVAGEMKTKPTQHSVKELREIGIMPDILLCRTRSPLPKDMKEKIALFCNVAPRAVISAVDIQSTIYEIPSWLRQEGLDRIVVEKLGLKAHEHDWSPWQKIVDTIKSAPRCARIAVIGKYMELQDAYRSLFEAIIHGGIGNDSRVEIVKFDAEDLEQRPAGEILADVDGILVPGGFGMRGIEGKIQAIRYARENRIPFFGICLGLQCCVIEFTRNACGLAGANSTEFDPKTSHPVVSLLAEQRDIVDMGGTLRLGAWPCTVKPSSRAQSAYGQDEIMERHRHRYEVNNAYIEQMQEHGMIVSGICPQGNLVEMVEIPDHPWFVACQFHPEFKSRPRNPHPLFRDFVRAALEYQT
ncbi:MAG TPA: CTP synthase, partial [bacterium]|nr:CTP synthase [bacterium]